MTYIEPLNRSQTFPGLYYAKILYQLDADLQKNCPFDEKMLFHHNKALAHTFTLATSKLAKLAKLVYDLHPHQFYLSDLASAPFSKYEEGTHQADI